MRRAKFPVAALWPLLLLAAAPAGDTWSYRLDPSSSAVSARVAFFGLSSKTAKFPSVSGRLTLPRAAAGAGRGQSRWTSSSMPAPLTRPIR